MNSPLADIPQSIPRCLLFIFTFSPQGMARFVTQLSLRASRHPIGSSRHLTVTRPSIAHEHEPCATRCCHLATKMRYCRSAPRTCGGAEAAVRCVGNNHAVGTSGCVEKEHFLYTLLGIIRVLGRISWV